MELAMLIERKQKALEKANEFKENAWKFNSFIKFSENLEEEIQKIKIYNSVLPKLSQINENSSNNKIFEINNSLLEAKEIDEYIGIFLKYNFEKHYEVNEYITKNKLWENFPNIRSLNTHGKNKDIPGILPKFFKQICEKLKIKNFCGHPLDSAKPY